MLILDRSIDAYLGSINHMEHEKDKTWIEIPSVVTTKTTNMFILKQICQDILLS